MQSPPFPSQFPLSGTAPTTPPAWALEIIDDIKSIKLSVSKIDKIEKLVDKINTKVEKLERDITSIDTRVVEVEKGASFINSEFEETKQKIKAADTHIQKLSKQCEQFQNTIEKLELKNITLESKANDLEARSMRENLLFHGIAETNGENCETLVKSFITDTLNIKEQITLDRAHRIGKPNSNGPRPIVAKFHSYRTRELVRTTAATMATELRNAEQGVGIQQTKAVLQKRREMCAIVDRERAAGHQFKWAGSRLLVRNGDQGPYREVTS
jgi:DNA repair exonuclease SbcCD ATPase subunit